MEKVKKVADVAKKSGIKFKFDKASLLKLAMSIIPMLTKGKVKRSDVLAAVFAVGMGSLYVGPTAIQPQIDDMKAQQDAMFGTSYELPAPVVAVDTLIIK